MSYYNSGGFSATPAPCRKVLAKFQYGDYWPRIHRNCDTASSAETIFPEVECITANSSNISCIKNGKSLSGDLELAFSLMHTAYEVDKTNSIGKGIAASDFIRSVQDSFAPSNTELHFIVNAENLENIFSDQSLSVAQVPSIEDFKTTTNAWLKALSHDKYIADQLSIGISGYLDQVANDTKPFMWQMKQPNIGSEDIFLQDYQELQNKSTRGNLIVQLIYEDSDGTKITCSKKFNNALPHINDLTDCKTKEEYINTISDLETGIRRSTQEVSKFFFEVSMQPKGIADDSNKSKAIFPRMVQIESMLGRTVGWIPRSVSELDLPPHMRLWTSEMQEITTGLFLKIPFESTSELLNRIQYRDNNTKISKRTIDDCAQRWGEAAHQNQLEQASNALDAAGFDPNTLKPKDGVTLSKSITDPEIPDDIVNIVQESYNHVISEYIKDNPNCPHITEEVIKSLECPNHAVVILIDDIMSKHQKEKRRKDGNPGSKSSQYVINTVVWVKTPESIYAITANDTREGLKLALGYLLKNNLLDDRKIIVLSDGARSIRNNVEEIFSFHKPLEIKLDWYHVCRRVNENLSMGLKCGRKNRERNKKVIGLVLYHIWNGEVDKAIQVLKTIDSDMIRYQPKIDECIEYLENRRPYLYCYVARKITGLINSSNRVESLNNQLVAKRQKRNGMSWSIQGSHGLARLTMLAINQELSNWFKQGKVRFSPIRARDLSYKQPEIALAS